MGHRAAIVVAGTSTGLVQRHLNWNEQSREAAAVKGIYGILMLVGGVWLIYSAP